MSNNVIEDLRDFYNNIGFFEFGFQVKTNVDILDIRLTNIIRIVNNMIYLFENGRDIYFEYMQCAKSIKTTDYVIGMQRILQVDDVQFVRAVLEEIKYQLYMFVLYTRNEDLDKPTTLARIRDVRYSIILVINRFKDRYSKNHYISEN